MLPIIKWKQKPEQGLCVFVWRKTKTNRAHFKSVLISSGREQPVLQHIYRWRQLSIQNTLQEQGFWNEKDFRLSCFLYPTRRA